MKRFDVHNKTINQIVSQVDSRNRSPIGLEKMIREVKMLRANMLLGNIRDKEARGRTPANASSPSSYQGHATPLQ